MTNLKRKYSRTDLNKLFTLSYNQCVFPDCTNPIVVGKTDSSKEAIAGQICHIHAIGGKGPRAKPGLTEQELNSLDNLILCCGHHHPIIDKQHETYPADLLLQWKQAHESTMARIIKEGAKNAHPDVFRNRAFPEDLVDGEIEKQTAILRKARFFPEFENVSKSISFGRELIDRSLSGGTERVRCKALAWCARILSVSDEIETAKEYLDAAKKLGTCQEIDIAEAFIFSKAEDTNSALKTLGKHHTPEARSASFMIVATHKKLEGALEWLKVAGIEASDLDADGKFNLLSHLLTGGKWDQAKAIADSSITIEDFEKAPALYRFVAMANLVHAIPEDFRMLILGQIPFGAEEFPLDDSKNGIELRNRSIELFRKAGNIERLLSCPRAASFDEDFILWLELRDRTKREEARTRLEKALENVETGLRFVTLALDFGIKLDEKVIDREIERQFALNGEYTFDAAVARFSLAFIQKSEKHVVDYLEKYEEKLVGVIEQKTILKLKAEMHARSGQYEKAKLCHEKLKKEGVSIAELSRVQRLIEKAEGSDTLVSLVAQFKLSGDIQELIVLIKELEARQKLSDLAHYSKLLFDKTRAFPDAVRLAQAYFDNEEHAEVITFLSFNSVYLDQSGSLRLLLAQSYFEQGLLANALGELSKLPTAYEHSNIGGLRINIAIASGDWNSLTVHLANNYVRRYQMSAEELVSLAKLAFQISSPYAKDFLFLATKKGANDAHILTNAYGIAVEAGIEESEEVAGWLQNAAELSGENGPIQMISLDEMMERKPQWDERSSETWNKLASGQVPMFLAGEYLNKSLVELMLFPAITNIDEPDPRRRGAIPAYSGKRPTIEMPAIKVIGLDATALLTLGFLGILEKALQIFDQVYIPHSTMMWLFQENSKASFHQPSRIKKAHLIRDLISKGAIEKLQPSVVTNSDLSAKVGMELAELLSEASERKDEDKCQKIVIRSSPVQQIGSLRKNEADLSKYADSLSSCQALIEKLSQLGQITDKERLSAKSYLSLHEIPWPEQPEIADKAVLYLDGLTIAYLLHIGILGKLAPAGFRIIISAKEVEDGNSLISFEHASGKVRDVLEGVRTTLSHGLENGTIQLGKRLSAAEERKLSNQQHPSIEAISLANYCDGIVIDDRFLNRHSNIDGGEKTAKVITTLELLRDLYSRDHIPIEEYRKCKTLLRRACYFFVPLEEDELLHHITESIVRNGDVIESPDLRAIRENLLRARMTDWLSLPDEGPWIENLFKKFNHTLKGIWEEESELESILARSDWTLDLFDLRGWAHRLLGDIGEEVGNRGRLPYIMMIVSIPPEIPSKLKEEYWLWAESRVINPIKEEYPELYKLMLKSQMKYFDHLSEIEIDDESE